MINLEKNGALSSCERFLRAYLGDFNLSDAAAYLSEDIVWFGDQVISSGSNKKEALNLLSYGIDFYRQSHEIRSLDLQERALSPAISEVEGVLVLYDRKMNCERKFQIVAICQKSESGCLICSLHFNLRSETNRGPIDRYLNALFDTVPCGVLFFEKRESELALTYFNDSVSAATGYTREEYRQMVESDPFGFVAPEDAPRVRSEFNRLPDSKAQVDLRFRANAKTGDLWLNLNARTLRWGEDKTLVVASVVNITPEVNIHNQLKALIANVPGCVLMLEVDASGIRQTYLNPNFLQMIGYSWGAFVPHEVNGELPNIHPDDRPRIRRKINALMLGADSIDETIRVRKADDSYLWLNLRANTYHNEGTKRLFYGIFTDVDAKMRMISETEAARNTLESVITSLPGGVGLFSYSEGRLKPEYFSNRLCEIFGMTREQVIASINPEQPFGNLDEAQARAFLNNFLQTRPALPVTTDCAAKKQDGTPFWVRIHLSATTVNSQLIFNVIMHDVTDEVALRQKEIWQNERYRILGEVTNELIFDYEPHKDELTCRLWAQEKNENDITIGNTLSYLINSPWIHPDDRTASRDALAASAEKPMSTTFEFRCQMMKAGYRWYRASYISLADDSGKVFRVVGRVGDIQREKDRESAAMAAIKREALYRRCNTANAFIAQQFDLLTGKQVVSGADVRPAWLPEGMTFHETIVFLRENSIHPDDRQPISDGLRPPDVKRLRNEKAAVHSLELRLAPPSADAYRWTAVYLSAVYDDVTRRTYAFLVLIDIHEQKLKELKTHELAYTDAMTGLNNRVRFEKDVMGWLETNNTQRGFALAILDVDEFKNINDLLGRDYGNKVIRQAAETIKSLMNPQDFFCRYGVDDFAILLTNLPDEDALKGRMSDLCSALYRRADDLITVSVSVGCVYQPPCEEVCGNLYVKADRALRWAKLHGGNQYALHTPELDEPSNSQKPTPLLPLENNKKRIFIRTFGHFDVFVDEKAVLFNYSKAKELLALLVDRKGGFVSAGDAIACLWTDEPVDAGLQARYRKTAMHMKNILEKNGIENIVETISGKRRIVPAMIDCDYLDYLSGNCKASCLYRGSYLADYSWAESTVAELESMRDFMSKQS